MKIDLDNLNDAQRKAVLYTDGPQLVIAGAGSGKTRVLTYKIAHLLTEGYEPWRILALTFTIKAAKEMKERIATLVGKEISSRLWMGTFHSIFSRILHANAQAIGFRSDFTIYDTADSRSLIKSIIKEANLDDTVYKPATIQSIISNAKNNLITPSSYAQNKELRDIDNRSKRPLVYSIYNTYWTRCFKAGAMDFDDLLLYTNILFRDHPDIAQRYRDLFRYVLVDEYQDTNFSQHLIVSQLCRDSGKLCVVGDDAQSIYSFRGANIGNILNLQREYPNLRIDKLEQNYRSTQYIVDAANSLIKKNRNQIPKNVYSQRAKGNKVTLHSVYSDYEEGYLVANRIAETHLLHSEAYNNFAILYRTNSQSRTLEEALRKRNIPYRIYGGLAFYQRKEIKDTVAYMRLIINPNDEEALKRVINYPSRGIGETTLNKILTAAHTHNAGVWDVMTRPEEYNLAINSGTRKKLMGFVELITELQEISIQVPISEVTKQVLQRSGIVGDIFSSNTPENISRQENIQELVNGVEEFSSNRAEEGMETITLADFLAEISLITDQDRNDDNDTDKVTLMTIHASKGLEFKHIFITGMEEDLFPSIMSLEDASQIEEERRLLYVAVTRAQETCTMSYAQTRFRNGKTNTCRPSRFINDFDPNLLDRKDNKGEQESSHEPNNRMWGSWEKRESRIIYNTPTQPRKNLRRIEDVTTPTPTSRINQPQPEISAANSGLQPGCRIRHERFGEGVVESIDGTGDNCKIGVKFDIVGRKQLLLKFAKFTII